MSRYIDAEVLTDHMLERYNDLCEKYGDYDHYTTGYGDAIDTIENTPTADVVPRSEVEELKKIYRTYNKAIKYERQEVAREIFEEIDKEYGENCGAYRIDDLTYGQLWDYLAELKKKYIVEKGE